MQVLKDGKIKDTLSIRFDSNNDYNFSVKKGENYTFIALIYYETILYKIENNVGKNK